MTKTYVMTDPGYIINEQAWDKVVKGTSNLTRMHQELANELERMTNSDNVLVADTGYGDWQNEINRVGAGDSTILQYSFTADSGMVCVCEYNDEVKEALKDIPKECYALFTGDDSISIYLDEHPGWNVIQVANATGAGDFLVSSAEPEPEDEDEGE